MVQLRLRVAVLGAPTTGKTGFIQMVHSGGVQFPKSYLMTMGCDFVVKDVTIDESTTVEVTLLDIAGQKLYDRMVPTYRDAATAFIVMYDVSNKNTFEECEKWYQKAVESGTNLPILLIANKCDLADKCEVTESQGKLFAKAHKMQFYKCSALRGSGIQEPIEDLAKILLEMYNLRVRQLTHHLGINM